MAKIFLSIESPPTMCGIDKTNIARIETQFGPVEMILKSVENSGTLVTMTAEVSVVDIDGLLTKDQTLSFEGDRVSLVFNGGENQVSFVWERDKTTPHDVLAYMEPFKAAVLRQGGVWSTDYGKRIKEWVKSREQQLTLDPSQNVVLFFGRESVSTPLEAYDEEVFKTCVLGLGGKWLPEYSRRVEEWKVASFGSEPFLRLAGRRVTLTVGKNNCAFDLNTGITREILKSNVEFFGGTWREELWIQLHRWNQEEINATTA